MCRRRPYASLFSRRMKPRLELLENRLAPAIDLSVTSLVSNPNPAQGDVVTYTVTVVNNGPDAATGVGVRDQVPDAFGVPVSISAGGSVPAGTNDVEWTGLSLASGASLQLNYEVAAGTINTFIAPSVALGAQSWNRPTSSSAVATYQGWESFASATGPNVPQTLPGPSFGGNTGDNWPAVNAGGTANAFDSSAPGNGSFITSTGNLYSPNSVITPRIVVPNNLDASPGDNPNGWTTILLQFRTAGEAIDPKSVKLNGSIKPVDRALIASAPVPGLGVRETWAFEFQVAGNADSYTLDFHGAAASVSFDRVAVDTIWSPNAANQAEAYFLPLPAVFTNLAQITAANEVDSDSAPNNGSTVHQDDDSSVGVAIGTTPPEVELQVVSVTPNANLAGLAGAQRSRVASLVVVFNQPVQLEADAIRLALHTGNVRLDGVPQASGYGSLPAALDVSTSDHITWVVSFSGNTDDGTDGFRSIKDGVYEVKIDAAKVSATAAPAVKMADNWMSTFHRLFGDTSAPSTPPGGTPGADFQAVVNTGDNLAFRNAFNNPATYLAQFDFNGDGVINTGDNLQFRNRFNKALTWSA